MELLQIGCKNCGNLIAFNSDEAHKNCPRCGILVKNEVTCLVCMFTGTNSDFASNECPNCKFSGLARSEEEALLIANNLRQITRKNGKVQIHGTGGKIYYF
jgi:predicted RNA-binding Zn-ribbon protein involved in translation (DUF1610 family)